jgi:hypothetical protein
MTTQQTRRPRSRRTTIKSLVQIADGKEKPYPVYNFNGRRFVEKPGRAYGD